MTSPSPEAVQVIYWSLSLLMAIGVWAFLSRWPKIRLWLFGTKKPTSGPAQRTAVSDLNRVRGRMGLSVLDDNSSTTYAWGVTTTLFALCERIEALERGGSLGNRLNAVLTAIGEMPEPKEAQTAGEYADDLRLWTERVRSAAGKTP